VLYQLPAQMPRNVERLAAFLPALPRDVKHAIEFRHPDWYDDEVLSLLRKHDVALCLHDMPDSVSPRTVTSGFVYIRFHGSGSRYGGAYPMEHLKEWASWLRSTGVPVFAYFNNDIGGHAPRDAAALRQLLGRS
jgi:uncharacterized protein YecE (DUF72 family)